MKTGSPFGTHRVIEPEGTMPQAAWKIDNTMEPYSNEILVDVLTLNLDSASFHQIREAAGGDEEKIKETIFKTVADRGKQHNPVTGSGGMFIGQIAQVGDDLKDKVQVGPGDRIASLVSLSLTPLKIESIEKIDLESGQIDVKAQAILFETGVYAKLPSDMPEKVALAVLDVAGAPAQVSRLVKKDDTVVVLGPGGKSGLLCLHEARKQAGPGGKIIALYRSENAAKRVHATGLADMVLQADANRPTDTYHVVNEATGGKMADVAINCTNVPGTEMSSILSVHDGGKVYFFNMATSFTAAALGAEGVGKDAELIIGNGYAKGHADYSLNILRENETLREMFHELFGS
ncbi:MAG: L-erythro-3,5-diaminohexanoate dehydrogenase [Myxococcota bacterium]